MSEKTKFGLSCALVTPFAETGAVDLPRLAFHARRVVERGCDTVTLYGTTGEGAAIGLLERERMAGAVVAGGVEAGRLYAGVASAVLDDAITQGRIALDLGMRGLLVAPPFYFKSIDEEALYRWFATFIEGLGAAARGIVLYHIPSMTSVGLSVDLVGRLKAAFPGVITAVKDSASNWEGTQAFLAAHPDLHILVGDERLLSRAVRAGAGGSICGFANFAPEMLRPVIYGGADNPDVNRIVDAVVKHPVMAATKALVGHVYQDSGYGPMRPPLRALTAAERAELFATFDGIMAKAAA
ncbi:dihydrodipicolinate synthase family protein [Prosthecomicrobium hirschii]|uniref:dihydrodipicolinate synthase family protein n=1 Tax=Prosthecodimorpha hirschii TaxID=665126 RepID=UPI001126D82E|nr:dihydrodipicolinate synthase family protein [Prosthecomicrobium hirschii]TPQ52633.1 dihydrodipicolinate synthase family protein [Prosthecomicrobium hirschii]